MSKAHYTDELGIDINYIYSNDRRIFIASSGDIPALPVNDSEIGVDTMESSTPASRGVWTYKKPPLNTHFNYMWQSTKPKRAFSTNEPRIFHEFPYWRDGRYVGEELNPQWSTPVNVNEHSVLCQCPMDDIPSIPRVSNAYLLKIGSGATLPIKTCKHEILFVTNAGHKPENPSFKKWPQRTEEVTTLGRYQWVSFRKEAQYCLEHKCLKHDAWHEPVLWRTYSDLYQELTPWQKAKGFWKSYSEFDLDLT